ncbi:hypothetical protein CMEL01_06764 [Colletotrichum melonis]|uniref:Uncharacterized protein n=1 Tax=Colletotrichum melonis TaxID=1209925 RepID=A0AAI9U997_9PEZI|nr:hypothetical protein CMEL01_06764 [Colletotrichum melonis]
MLSAANHSNAKKGLRRRAAVGNVRDGDVYCVPLSLAAPPETQIDRNLSPLPDQNECTHRLSRVSDRPRGFWGLFAPWAVQAGSNVVSPAVGWKAGKRDDSQARTVEAQTSSNFPAVARDGRDPAIAPAKRAQ